ncbi:MAG TPA: hypothetical protein EYN66_16980 [Myxococcales bacterium]|nr:hypothetical protein [Myxococcales bacterium]
MGAKADVPTTVDYDGDLQHNNNWDSLPGKKIRPYLYYGITVSETHYFLTYSQYHPRDWEAICLGLTGACHEGDMESVWIVAKRAESGFGKVLFVRAHHHGETTTWSNDSTIGEKVNLLSGIDFEDLEGSIAAKQGDSQSHVRIFSEAHGHGTSPCTAQELFFKPFGMVNISCPDSSGRTFPGGDGIKFVPTLEEPAFYKAGTENSDTAVEYGLVPISETLWQWRAQVGVNQMFRDKDPFIYLGAQGVPFVSEGQIGSHFDVEQFANDDLSGSAPWSRTLDGSEQGDVFLDPAWAYKKWLNLSQNWSLKYTYHPYLNVVETP